jgi:4-diphosphocytidyl-2-C-methyl-D-erythritol kinase
MSNLVVTQKSYPKVNVFLKISGKRDNYHEIVSRFVKVYSIYDTFCIYKKSVKEFTLIGEFGCKLEQNTIYKAYLTLKDKYPEVERFYKSHIIEVDKKVPYFAGLGGGSSNCATFLLLTNKLCDLNLSKETLANIGLSIGADVPFFIYEYDSANVTGIGEIVEKFKEERLDITAFTPDIVCNTGEIFRTFREKFYKEISTKDAQVLLNTKSKDIFKNLSINQANDLYDPVVYLYNDIVSYRSKFTNKKCFFSGSGSSFFRIDYSVSV